MWRKLILGAVVVAGCAQLVHAADSDNIKAGLQKLADSPNYSWKSVVEGGYGAGETDGKTQSDGLTSLSITRQDNSFQVFIQNGKGVAKTDDGWQTAAELTADDGGGGGPSPERMLGMMIENFKTPVAMAQAAIVKLQNVQKTDDGYTADLSEDAAKQLLTFRRRNQNANGQGPTITNAKASVHIWIKDGIVAKLLHHVTGTVSFNGNDRDIDRTTTTEFTDVGSTKITIPDDAKAKLNAPPATQP
jgi:hypothetical protein